MKKHEPRMGFQLKYSQITEEKAETRGWIFAIMLFLFSAGLQSAITVRQPGVVLARCFRNFRVIAANERNTSDVSQNERRRNDKQKTRANRKGSPLSLVQYGENITRDYVRKSFFFQIHFFSCSSTENTCHSSVTLSYVIFRELFIFLCIYFTKSSFHFTNICFSPPTLRKAPERPVRNTFVTHDATRVTCVTVSPFPPLLRLYLTSSVHVHFLSPRVADFRRNIVTIAAFYQTDSSANAVYLYTCILLCRPFLLACLKTAPKLRR